MKIALLGAESSGKTLLSLALGDALRTRGSVVTVVPEVLREWCDNAGRTPQAHEQIGIARAQAERVDAAERDLLARPDVAEASVVIADTTPLMIAVYSDMLFDDRSLYDFALEHQRSYGATLLMGLDLPWVADGLQRDGPHVREPVDALVRKALERGGVSYQLVYGSGLARLTNALMALHNSAAGPQLMQHLNLPQRPDSETAQYRRWTCDKCSDAACEHRLFQDLQDTNG